MKQTTIICLSLCMVLIFTTCEKVDDPGPKVVINYDTLFFDSFDKFSNSLWRGTSTTALDENSLEIGSTGRTAYIYHIFDHDSIGEHSSLVSTFDLKFSDNLSYMNFRGHAEDGSIDWAPEILFRDGDIISHLHSGNVPTSFAYDLDKWYQFKLTMFNHMGPNGAYMLAVKTPESTSYTHLGSYPYFSHNGRLVDLVQISFGTAPGDSAEGSLQIDNVLILKPRE
ncbi:MAG: hypothetical protein K9M49_01985 [Candidatus Marinimicrobia bacterium]|nr:hypothetical protein [Candidatus Neomarinimicrobiota bacterium]MCF7850308.1 hypothetical protein [Candidatus Neomarinimicrobiota bacterium]MCF7903900.1 hypothetical protein [Candidatus Neomarinimicrobiota bacterium]